MNSSHDAALLLITVVAVVVLVLLIAWCKLPAFISLICVSLLAGLCAGRNPLDVSRSFAEGVGSVLGSIAMVIALGAILGKVLAVSGSAEQLGTTLIGTFGKRWIDGAIVCAAFVVGTSVFFSVGLVLLIPLISTAARQRSIPVAYYGLPLVAGLSITHGLVPPHPGPIAAVGILQANMGKTIVYALAVGVPSAWVCGVWLAPRLARISRIEPGQPQTPSGSNGENHPDFGVGASLTSISLPVVLMVASTATDLLLPQASAFRVCVDWLGNPVVAMLLGTLFSLWSLTRLRGFDKHQLCRLSEECLAPVATILLVVGAGGGFGRVLIDNGLGEAVARKASASGVPPLLLGWLVAALVRITTGSATVAITTASGLLAPVVAANPGLNRELMVVAMGAGSLMLSHVNDGGFWLVKEYLGLTVPQTLRTWTVLETAISLVAFVLVLLLALVIQPSTS
jgi:GntP family gluconate:H+ symporter